jgi:predicted acyltransferase
LADNTTTQTRLLSVDVFRGMTIVGMILVNNPGNLKTTYWPLQHAEWHGWTPTDLVFPFFLFIVGVAIVLALKRRLDAGTSKRPLVMKVVKRSAIIFGLGLFLSGYPFGLFGPRGFGELVEVWRIPGVLQRIAICYLVVSLLVLFCRVRTLKILTVVFLVGYWALMTLVPVPGLGAPDIDDPGGHLSAWIDRAVFGDHVWQYAKVYDPEGVLSTIPAAPGGGSGPGREGGAALCPGQRPHRCRLHLGLVLPDQQADLDQLVRGVHRRPRLLLPRPVPVVLRYS